MRLLSMLIITASLLFTGPAFAAPVRSLVLKDNALLNANTGQRIPLEDVRVQAIPGSSLRFVDICDHEAEKTNLVQGIYIFDQAGKQVVRVCDEVPPVDATVLLSPDGKTLLVTLSSSSMGAWEFYELAGGKSLGSVRTFLGATPPIWATDTILLANTMGPDRPERKGCDSELGATPVSVTAYDTSTRKATLLFPFEGLCDIILSGYKDGIVTVEKACNTKEQWRKTQLNNPKVQKLTRMLK